ncbi:MAG: hypothetical protein HN462_01575 [Candidatus Marinimicrobia bacterium]|nr:hypothetical protein [Candidatus Neomarinimicrobiota bacterium]MBT6914524.1 hypothetical protein [Candidatus Neomarinimicrobiota bacterium]
MADRKIGSLQDKQVSGKIKSKANNLAEVNGVLIVENLRISITKFMQRIWQISIANFKNPLKNLIRKLKKLQFSCFLLENVSIKPLLISFPALIRKMVSIFSLRTEFCKGFFNKLK